MKENWRKVLGWAEPQSKAAYPIAHRVAKEISILLLGKVSMFIDPTTYGYRVALNDARFNVPSAEDRDIQIQKFQQKVNDAGYTGVIIKHGIGAARDRIFAIVPYNIQGSLPNKIR